MIRGEGWAESLWDCGRGRDGGGVRVDICLFFSSRCPPWAPPCGQVLRDRGGVGRFGTPNLMGMCGRGRWEGLSYFSLYDQWLFMRLSHCLILSCPSDMGMVAPTQWLFMRVGLCLINSCPSDMGMASSHQLNGSSCDSIRSALQLFFGCEYGFLAPTQWLFMRLSLCVCDQQLPI